MKRSTRCDYVLRAILELSHYYNKKLVRVSDLSASQGIPHKYLEQIMVQLKKSGFVESKKGPKGGYSLARPPEKIFLGEVIRVIDERWFSIEHSKPLKDLTTMNMAKMNFFGVWSEVQEAITSVLDKISLKEIQQREAEILSQQNQGVMYYI